MFCARLFICAFWSPAGKGLTSWLSFVVSSVSLSLSHWYPGSGVVLDCIDSWSLHHYLLWFSCYLLWLSCSLYFFHSEQAEQNSSVLEHLCLRTPEYSVFRGGVDRTVTWPVPKQDGLALLACVEIFASLDLFRSTPKCPVLLVYVAVLAYAEYSKNC